MHQLFHKFTHNTGSTLFLSPDMANSMSDTHSSMSVTPFPTTNDTIQLFGSGLTLITSGDDTRAATVSVIL